MKMMKKLTALALAVVLMLALSVTALAVDISIEKDGSNVDPTATTYTYYKIFDATYNSNTTTDDTISADPQEATEGFSYTIPASSPLLTIDSDGGLSSIIPS